MTFRLSALAACFAIIATSACAQQEMEFIAFDGVNYEVPVDRVEVRDFMGRSALYLNRSFANSVDVQLEEGVIEFDFASAHQSGFVGVSFHDHDVIGEQFYVRFHNTGLPDATQYTPVLGGLAGWQIYTGPNFAVATDVPAEYWNHVRIVIEGDRADIFFNDMDTPLIHVPDLLSNVGGGGVALYASDRPGMDTGAYFSNIVVRPLESGEGVIGVAAEEAELPSGLVTEWSVSEPFSEDLLIGYASLAHMDLEELTWAALDVERNGIANLGRLAGPTPEAQTVFARMTLSAEEAELRLVRFGYSDRVRVYLNGELLFLANSRWRSRDHRFLGTIGWEDQIAAHLRAGDNELIFAVSEAFGGWGVTAAVVED